VAAEIAVGVAAIDVIRDVGPTAWMVLTALALDAEHEGGTVVARASVRSLAARPQLDKDTVGRAMARLRAQRHARAATAVVTEAEAQVARLHYAGQTVKDTLDRLEAEASRLQSVAHPGPQGLHLERLYDDQLAPHDDMLAALNTIDRWYRGTCVRTCDLNDAIATITMPVRGVVGPAAGPDEITPDNWNDFLVPVIDALDIEDIELPANRALAVEPDTVSVEL
jgi:hypothetical protein